MTMLSSTKSLQKQCGLLADVFFTSILISSLYCCLVVTFQLIKAKLSSDVVVDVIVMSRQLIE